MFKIKKPVRALLDKNKVVLVDGDVVAYQAAYGREHVDAVKAEVKMILNRIKDDTGAFHMIIYLTGKENFRNDVAMLQQYKGNRYNPDGSRKKPQPKLLPEARLELFTMYRAELQATQEADDALVIAQTAFNKNAESDVQSTVSCISTIDKDLRISPGLHHNIGNSEVDKVDRLGYIYCKGSTLKGCGLKFFYSQLLMGDSTDNIKGLPQVTEEMVVSFGLRRGGCGGMGAARIISEAESELELFTIVYDQYQSYWADTPISARKIQAADWRTGKSICSDPLDRLTEMGQLLWMRTYSGEMWTPPADLLAMYYWNEIADLEEGDLDD